MKKLNMLKAPFNFILHYYPSNKHNDPFHIEILPRFNNRAGFEYSGTFTNSLSPECAVRYYRATS